MFDEDIAKAMAESGCWNVGFGVESFDDDVLMKVKKGETTAQIERAINIARKYFRIINGFLIIGLPGSTYQKDLKGFEWARKKRINAHFSYYVPFDKQVQKDKIFYGDAAEPLSDEYSKELQKKIYDMTAYMRPEKNLVKRGVNKAKRLRDRYLYRERAT